MAIVQDGFKLEVAFASTPFDAAPSWTDITAYWVLRQPTTITRGRGSEQDQVQTGTVSLTLDNTDGRFTLGNTSGAYYPNVKLRKQIRITYTQTAVTYPIFKGYVDEWPVEWPDGGETYAWAQVRASDRFKVLGRRTLRSLVQEEVLEPGAYQYYQLNEPEGATAAGDIAGTAGNELLTISQVGTGGSGTVAFGTGTGPPTDGATATIFTPADQDNGKFLTGAVANPGGGTAGRSLIAVIRTTATPSATSVNVATAYSASSGYLGLAVDTAGNLKGFISNGTSTANIIGTTVNDGSTHFVAATVLSNGNFILYVDGVNVVSTAWTHTISQTSSLDVAGYSGNAGGFFRGGLFTGTISHVAYFNSELDATTVARLQTAFTTAFANESTGSRAGRVADWGGVATADRSIDTGMTTSIRHVDTTGKTAQGFLQELADTEGGLVFMDASGKLQFQDRGTRINATAALTLSATSQQVSPDVQYRANDQLVINDVTYTRDGGATFRAVDATSVTDNGAIGPGTVETYTTDDDQVRDQATWVVYTSKTPIARIEGLGVDMLTDSASRIAAVQLELSSKVTVTGMPGAAPGSSTSVFVEGYTETISDTEWTRVLNTSPADLFSPLWQLGTAGFSELGDTTRLNF